MPRNDDRRMPSWSAGPTRAVAALLICLLLAPRAAPAAVFDPEVATLDNGMKVVVVSHHRAPVVSHMVWYRVGAMDEPPGKSGIAHVLEHLMFKGTEKHPDNTFSRIVSRLGGEQNAFTSSDYTGYYQNVAKDRLGLMMALEADRMTNLVLTPETVEPEIDVVLEERRQRIDNDPAAQINERAGAAMFLNHPYRRPIIGWEGEIAALTVDDIMAFYRAWYSPNNAVLVVAGDVTMADVLPLAERYYGAIPPAVLPERPVFFEPEPLAERRVELADARVHQPNWSRRYRAPGYGLGATANADALQVASEILGGDATSRLYRLLVVEAGLAVSAGSWYDPSRRGPGEFVVYASPRPGVSLRELEAGVDRVLADFAADGPTDAETTRATRGLRAQAVYARDSLSRGAFVLGEALAIGRTVDDIESWPERIAGVDAAAVSEAIRDVLTPVGTVTALLRAPAKEPEQAIQ